MAPSISTNPRQKIAPVRKGHEKEAPDQRGASLYLSGSRACRKHGPVRSRGPSASLLLAALVAAISLLAVTPRPAAADGPSLAIDANPIGNEPKELGSLDSCFAVSTGDRFPVDVIIQDVEDLLAWELYFEYDPSIVEVTSASVDLFQAANPSSSVFDVSEDVPDSDGLYRLGAADTADPPSPDSGSGVLARLTLRALAPGESPLALSSRDLDGDGEPDLGPFLRDVDAEVIGDDSGDTFFDGPIQDAIVVVDRPCPPGSTTSGPGAVSSDGGIPTVYIWAPALGAVLLAAVTAILLLFRRRLRAQAEEP